MKIDPNDIAWRGMTLRVELAARAMQALVTTHYSPSKSLHWSPALIAGKAIEIADALIAELGKD